MGWIKRNLFFTIGGVLALTLLGAAAYYNFKSWSHNRGALANLEEAFGALQGYYNQKPTPSPDNIATDKAQERQLREWIAQARTNFVAVLPIPNPPDGVVTTEEFAGSLRETIHNMQAEAVEANVDVPPDYSFSFAGERNLVTFAPGSLNALASHLGEIKAICEILFAAKINAIDGIQREMVSDNDSTGPQSDYLAEKTRSVDSATGKSLATITPYIVTFRCFSSDLADVLSSLASSDHCFIVTGVNVMPAGAATPENDQNPQFGMPMPGMRQFGRQFGMPQPKMPMTGANEGLQTVLDEQLLRVTLGIEVVKLTK